jgi:hypothetical protein
MHEKERSAALSRDREGGAIFSNENRSRGTCAIVEGRKLRQAKPEKQA